MGSNGYVDSGGLSELAGACVLVTNLIVCVLRHTSRGRLWSSHATQPSSSVLW